MHLDSIWENLSAIIWKEHKKVLNGNTLDKIMAKWNIFNFDRCLNLFNLENILRDKLWYDYKRTI